MSNTAKIVGLIMKIAAGSGNGPGTVTIKRDSDGKEVLVKAWADAIEGKNPGDKGEFELFNKPYNNQDQWYLSAPKKAGGRGGGGPAKSDPVKNEIIKSANKNNNDTIAYASNLKAATSCMEMSVATLGAGLDVNEYRDRAFDIYQAVRELASIGSREAK